MSAARRWLPSEDDCLLRWYRRGWSLPDIAKKIGRSASAVKNRLHQKNHTTGVKWKVVHGGREQHGGREHRPRPEPPIVCTAEELALARQIRVSGPVPAAVATLALGLGLMASVLLTVTGGRCYLTTRGEMMADSAGRAT